MKRGKSDSGKGTGCAVVGYRIAVWLRLSANSAAFCGAFRGFRSGVRAVYWRRFTYEETGEKQQGQRDGRTSG